MSCLLHRVTSGQSNSGHNESNSSSSSNWILVSCLLHRVTSGQSNSGHNESNSSSSSNWILVSCLLHWSPRDSQTQVITKATVVVVVTGF